MDVDDMLRALVDRLKQKKLRASDLFRNIDSSEDGNISASELRTGLVDLGMKFSDHDFSLIMAKIDKDGGGDISLREFDKALKAAEKLPARKKSVEMVQKPTGLTSDDINEFRQIFCLFKQLCRKEFCDGTQKGDLVEWDDTGSISVDELEQLLETVGMRLTQKELKAMVKDIDLDGDGEIDFHEFCEKMTQKIQVSQSPEEITKSFKSFARNAPDGYIRVKDLREALCVHMHKDLCPGEVEALLLHYKDCFVKLPGHEHEYFHYQDYIDLMTPIVDRAE